MVLATDFKFMKKIILILICFLCIECSVDDCIKSAGESISEEVMLEPFQKIYVFKGISATIHQSHEHKIVINTGKNIRPHISFELIDGTLTLRDNLTCNWARDYGITHIDIYSPLLTEIHSRTEKNINSNGVLTYPSLGLFAIDLEEGAGLGDFHFQINNDYFQIGTNNVSSFYISGQTKDFNLGMFSGLGKIKTENLMVQNHIEVFHRGNNDAYVYPLGTISGNMYGLGNLILKHQPTSIAIIQHFSGSVIHDY